jgi:predicted transcriptional regulator
LKESGFKMENTERRLAQPIGMQSLAVFSVLASEKRIMTAAQIADRVGIDSRNVSRLVKPLLRVGMVRIGTLRVGKGRRLYSARPILYAEKMYLAYVRNEFRAMFDDAYRSR